MSWDWTPLLLLDALLLVLITTTIVVAALYPGISAWLGSGRKRNRRT